jgi:hypothetical protein
MEQKDGAAKNGAVKHGVVTSIAVKHGAAEQQWQGQRRMEHEAEMRQTASHGAGKHGAWSSKL